MKKFFLLFLLIFVINNKISYAIDFGFGEFNILPYASVGYYNLSISPTDFPNQKYKISGLGGGAGVQLEFDITENITINPGIEFLTTSSEKPDSTILVKLKDSYINIPIMLNYWITTKIGDEIEETGFYIGVGPKLTFPIMSETESSLSYRSPIAKKFNVPIGGKFDTKMGIIASINAGYQLIEGARINFIFDYGLNNIISNKDKENSIEGNYLFVGAQVGWLF